MNKLAQKTFEADKIEQDWRRRWLSGEIDIEAEENQGVWHELRARTNHYLKLELKELKDEIAEARGMVGNAYPIHNMSRKEYDVVLPILRRYHDSDFSPRGYRSFGWFFSQKTARGKVGRDYEKLIFDLLDKDEEWLALLSFGGFGSDLAEVCVVQDAPWLERVVREERLKDIRRWAFYALTDFGREYCEPLALEFIGSDDEDLYWPAFGAIRKYVIAESKEQLEHIMASHPDAKFKKEVKKTLKILQNGKPNDNKPKDNKPLSIPKMPKASVVVDENLPLYETSVGWDMSVLPQLLRSISSSLGLRLPQKALIYQAQQMELDTDGNCITENPLGFDVVVPFSAPTPAHAGLIDFFKKAPAPSSTPPQKQALYIEFFLDDVDAIDVSFFSNNEALIRAIGEQIRLASDEQGF